MSRIQSYGRWLIRRRWWVIVLSLALSLLAAAGATRLQMNPDNRVFFSEDNPQLLALEELEKKYTKTDNVFLAIAPKDGTVFTAKTLSAIRELTETAWQIPYSSRVDSLSNFQYTEASDDELIVSDLVPDSSEPDDAAISKIRDIALSEPLLLNRLISADGSVAGMNITVIKPGNNTNEVFEAADFTRKMVAGFEQKYPDIEVYASGGVLYDTAFSEIPEQESMKLLPLTFALILIIVGVALRTVWSTIMVLLLIGLSVAVSLGLTGWSGTMLNAGTTGAPVIILTLSVAHSVHIFSTLRQQMLNGMNQLDAVAESLRINVAPIFITSVTTAVGFLSLNFSDAPPFRLLGNMVAVGVLAGFILSLTLLPAVLSVVRIRVKPVENRTLGGRLMDTLSGLVIRHRDLFLLTTGVSFILLSLGIFHISLDDNFIKYFDQRYQIRSDTDFIEQNLTGMNALEYSFPAGQDGGINDPDYLNDLDQFVKWLEQQPKVTNVNALTHVIKRLNKNMHNDDPEFYRIPESRDLAAQYLLLYEMSLPYGLDLNNQIDVGKAESKIVVLVSEASSKELREMDQRAQVWLKQNTPERATPSTGLSMIFAHISERNINSMLFGSFIALSLISLILILALKSLQMGLISLIPNLFPAAMALGIWGYFVGEAGLAVAVVVAMTLGIVVDDTVHFLSKYLRARRELNKSAEEAVRFTFSTVGMALWITSVALTAGFAVLFFSGFKATSEMGVLSAVTIVLALLADFLFLPALLLKLDRRKAVAVD